jgi:S1-C subfamily serine protease
MSGAQAVIVPKKSADDAALARFWRQPRFFLLVAVLSVSPELFALRAEARDLGACAFYTHGAATAYIEYTFVGPLAEHKTISGSGFVVSADGYLLTAAHVLRPEDPEQKVVQETVSVRLGSLSSPAYTAKIVLRDREHDVALLKLAQLHNLWPVVPIGESLKLKAGDPLAGLGFPEADLSIIPTGMITAKQTVFHGVTEEWWQTSLSLNPGDSGGPVFSRSGLVVGLSSAFKDGAYAISYVVPLTYAKAALAKAGVRPKVIGICGSASGDDSAPTTAEQAGVGKTGYVYYEEKDGALTQDGVFGPPSGGPAPPYGKLGVGAVLRSVKTARMRAGPLGTSMLVAKVEAGYCVRLTSGPEFPVTVAQASSGGRVQVTVLSSCPQR